MIDIFDLFCCSAFALFLAILLRILGGGLNA